MSINRRILWKISASTSHVSPSSCTLDYREYATASPHCSSAIVKGFWSYVRRHMPACWSSGFLLV